MGYVHVHRTHIEEAWMAGHQRAAEVEPAAVLVLAGDLVSPRVATRRRPRRCLAHHRCAGLGDPAVDTPAEPDGETIAVTAVDYGVEGLPATANVTGPAARSSPN